MIALIRPKRRKAHLATSSADQWLPLCDSVPVSIDGTPFLSIEAASESVAIEDTTVCVYCLRMIAFAQVLEHFDSISGGDRHLRAVAS